MRLNKMVSAAMAQHKKISALPGKLQYSDCGGRAL